MNMNTWRAIYHLARADFLERIQRYSFVFTLLATAYLGLGVVAGDIHLHLGAYRGVFNSAWVGLLMAMTTSAFVSLAGFYLGATIALLVVALIGRRRQMEIA